MREEEKENERKRVSIRAWLDTASLTEEEIERMKYYLFVTRPECRKKNKTNRGEFSITLSQHYKNFCELTGNKKKIPQTIYCNIVRDMFSAFSDKMILDNYQWRLPYNLGQLSVIKKKIILRLKKDGSLDTRFLRVDKKATVQMWKEHPELVHKQYVYFTNNHTGGYYMRLHYDKTTAQVTNLRHYICRSSSAFRKKISNYLKTNPRLNFYEI